MSDFTLPTRRHLVELTPEQAQARAEGWRTYCLEGFAKATSFFRSCNLTPEMKGWSEDEWRRRSIAAVIAMTDCTETEAIAAFKD